MKTEGNSAGFKWFRSKRQALASAADDNRRAENDAEKTEPAAEAITIIPTKEGILAALRQYASHPDNG